MALLGMEGYDDSRQPSGFSMGGTVSYTSGRSTNGKAAQSANTSAGAGLTVNASWTFTGAGGSSQYVGVALRFSGSTAGSGTSRLLSLREGGTVHVAIVYRSDGKVDLIRGDGTVLGTTSFAIDPTLWNHYCIDTTVHDTTGYAAFWFNGSKVIEVSGVDTRNGGAVGIIDNALATGTNLPFSSTPTFFVDDWYRGDHSGPAPYNAPVGDCVIMPLRPNGNGDVNQWVGSDANSTDNYLLVDDVSTTTDYVGSPTSGNKDLYEVTNLDTPNPGITQTVLAVQTSLLAAKSDAGVVPDLQAVLRSGSTDVEDVETVTPGAALSTSFSWFQGSVKTADPDGAAWTVASANAIQVGVKNS